jgi:hypothetical protein
LKDARYNTFKNITSKNNGIYYNEPAAFISNSYSNSFENLYTNNDSTGVLIEKNSYGNKIERAVINASRFYGVYLKANSSSNNSNLFKDSIINNTIKYSDVFLITPDDSSLNTNIFLNTSYNSSTIHTNCTLIRQWYLDVYVNDTIGNPINQANVTGWNVTDTLIFSELTEANGRITRQNLTEYINNSGLKTFWTNYTVNASKTGFIQQTKKVNLTTNKFEVFTLYSI